MKKRIISLFCCLSIVFSLAGCGAKKTSSDADTNTGDAGGFMNFGAGTADNTSLETGTTSDGNVTVKVETPDAPTKNNSVLANKNYGGKKYTILYYYTPDTLRNRTIEAFNKKHNANVTMEITNKDPNVAMAEAIASGKPYDIVANHADFFPQSIFQGIYEPLEGYISKEDMFDSDNPENGGLNTSVNDRFAFNGHYYALGSAKSVYQYCMYYNKKMFKESGLEDPWELYKKGEWTWEKIIEMHNKVTDFNSETYFISPSILNRFMTANAVDGIIFKNGTYTENMSSAKFIEAAQLYRDFFHGENPLCPVTIEGDAFADGRFYLTWYTIDAYRTYRNGAKLSSAFDRNGDNLGVVPFAYFPLNKDKKYPAEAAMGYSATAGCKDPSVAACYALFESRYTDNSNAKDAFPTEVLKEIQFQFAKNGFIGHHGFKNSEGDGYDWVLDFYMGPKIREGADVVQTINDFRPKIQSGILYSVQSKK